MSGPEQADPGPDARHRGYDRGQQPAGQPVNPTVDDGPRNPVDALNAVPEPAPAP